MRKPVYLDHHATTPLDPRVLEAMLPYFGPKFGNAASRSHSFGWEAEKAVDFARKRVADLAGAAPREVVFTSGATESNNLAIKGVAEAYRAQGDHIVTMSTEHKSVLDTVQHLEHLGCGVTVLPSQADGLLDLARLREAIGPRTILVSIMYANNEIGVLQPVREIAAICHEKGVLFHCDAVQAFGKIPVSVRDGIDLMSVTAHKMYGPKGIGALIVPYRDPRVRVTAQIDGGGHENGMRSGTLNVPGIVGFGAACAIRAQEMEEEAPRLEALRDRLKHQIECGLAGIRINGSMVSRLPGNLNVSFSGVDGEALLTALPDIALSATSACGSAAGDSSYVLKALGVSNELAHAALRFGLGHSTIEEDVDYAARRVIEAVSGLRAQSPVAS